MHELKINRAIERISKDVPDDFIMITQSSLKSVSHNQNSESYP